MQKLWIPISDSFVEKTMKNQGSGSGEAKLYIGNMHMQHTYDDFFYNAFQNEKKLQFDFNNLNKYIEDIEKYYIPYVFLEKAATTLISHLKKQLERYSADAEFYISKYTDDTRYYIKSSDTLFKEWFRKFAVPLVTKIKIEEKEDAYHVSLYFHDENYPNKVLAYLTLGNSGNKSFTHFNILFKGVAGTGKSRLIDKIIYKYLGLTEKPNNILRINIHSASSNADLMQGIAISTTKDGNVLYEEKQGLIFEHIRKACFAPNQVFVLVLEEIQENTLNELIGDLIYLIEPTKRAKIDDISQINTDVFRDGNTFEYQELIEKYIEQARENLKEQKDNKIPENELNNLVPEYIQIPYLVDKKTEYRKMIMPNNFYIFCTSNYRDDKKVIEDNLLRRFHVVEVYPQYNNFESDDIGAFLECLNDAILKTLADDEIHEDRFLIGHANWIDIKEDEDKKFFEALLKFFIEFKEIREIEFDVVKNIFEVMNKCDKIKKLEDNENWAYTLYYTTFKNVKTDSYKEWVDTLQKKVYGDILELQSKSTK